MATAMAMATVATAMAMVATATTAMAATAMATAAKTVSYCLPDHVERSVTYIVYDAGD